MNISTVEGVRDKKLSKFRICYFSLKTTLCSSSIWVAHVLAWQYTESNASSITYICLATMIYDWIERYLLYEKKINGGLQFKYCNDKDGFNQYF